MTFGIVHYVYTINALIFTICALLLLRRYIKERNTLTLIFTLVMTCFAALGFGYLLRGLFTVNTLGSIIAYKFSIEATVIFPSLLLIFMLYPSIEQKGGFRKGGWVSGIVSIISVLTILVGFLVAAGDVTLTYTQYEMDIYSVSFGSISYLTLLALPILLSAVDSIGFASMAYKEKDQFYRRRAILLAIGWTLCFLGSLMLLSPNTLILNPIMFGSGGIMMSIAILRQAS